MALSNAERQARWRARLREKLANMAAAPIPEASRETETKPDSSEAATLPKTYREKYERLVQRVEREWTARLRMAVQLRVKEHLESVVMPGYQEKLDEADSIVKARKGVMTRKMYTLILSCLHPDSRNAVTDAKLKAAFIAWKDTKLLLMSEKEEPTEKPWVPRTYAEWEAIKAKVKADRKAKRAANKKTSVARK